MPNTFAYVALLSWPLIAIYLFSTKTFERAIIWSIVGSFLFLPSSFVIDFVGLPPLDKGTVPSLTLLVIVFIVTRNRFRILPKNQIAKTLFLIMVASSFFTALSNQDAILIGQRFLPGLRPYDAITNIGQNLLLIAPFLIGWQYLATVQAHRQILLIFLMAGLGYSLFALFEIRMSPQLHTWVYGYFPHSFAQQARGGGFRPVVFLEHGLVVAFFIFTVMFAAAALWRDSKSPGLSNTKTPYHARGEPQYLYAMGYLGIVLVLCKSFGSLLYGVFFVPFLLIARQKTQLRIAVLLALIALTYPLLRGVDMVPVNTVAELTSSYSAERAASFRTRVENEDRLLTRAEERPLFGWGGWGRSRIYDESTGHDVTLSDGYWIIVIGTSGWIGYLSLMGLLAFPIFAVWRLGRGRRNDDIPIVTSALCLLLGINLIELLPNATLQPWTWLISGSLLGYASNSDEVDADSLADFRGSLDGRSNPTSLKSGHRVV